MAKVAIISICLVGINLIYTNRKGSVFLTISCMITPRRHVRIDVGNYCCNECAFSRFCTLNMCYMITCMIICLGMIYYCSSLGGNYTIVDLII